MSRLPLAGPNDSSRTALPRAVSVACPAKVNLHLRVGPVRADGFHPLLTWMCTVGLFDTLEMRTGGRGERGGAAADVIRLTCEPPTVPADERNLVVRVARAWAERLRAEQPGAVLPAVDARLVKRTPVGAGLGGGSSDAACALLALDRLWGGGSPRAAEDLSAFAARFGSDVPFFLRGPSSVCTGRGEVVRPVAVPVARWAVLVLPPIVMPTPDVYRRFDAMGLGRAAEVEAEPDWQAWAALPAAELMSRVANDLEPPAMALRPELAEMRLVAERIAGRAVRMSGSGSSLFTLFDGRGEAEEAAVRLAVRLGSDGTRCEAVALAPAIRLVGEP
jgi:4-diphosphocytidyl-2-C-methyl-D-erythritol kinase